MNGPSRNGSKYYHGCSSPQNNFGFFELAGVLLGVGGWVGCRPSVMLRGRAGFIFIIVPSHSRTTMVLAYFSLAAREEGRDGKIGTNVSTKYNSRHLLLQLQIM